MIIRRRTYGGNNVGSYGYFMRNTTYLLSLFGTTHSNNIYTKCMLKEAPVGNFGYLTSDSVTILSSGSPGGTGYAAVGYTDGTTIIVANAKRLFKSVDGGASFTSLCTWNSSTYTSYYTGPIVFMYNDGSAIYYYVVYVDCQYVSYWTSGYYYLKVVKINTSGNIVSTTTVKSGYRTYNSGSVNPNISPFDTSYGNFFASKPSPWGHIMIPEVPTTSKMRWLVLDIPRLVCSGAISPSPTVGTDEGASYIGAYEATGLWFNDGSNYGAFHFNYSTKVYVNGSALYYRDTHFKVTTSMFNSNASLTVSNITSRLSTIINDNQWVSNGNSIADPNIFIAGCDYSSSKSTLFMVSTEFLNHTVKAYTSNRDLSGITEMTLPSDIHTTLRGGSTAYSKKIMGICVTPDGKYGVALYGHGAFVCDLENKKFVSAYCYADTEGSQIGAPEVSSFMLPAK